MTAFPIFIFVFQLQLQLCLFFSLFASQPAIPYSLLINESSLFLSDLPQTNHIIMASLTSKPLDSDAKSIISMQELDPLPVEDSPSDVENLENLESGEFLPQPDENPPKGVCGLPSPLGLRAHRWDAVCMFPSPQRRDPTQLDSTRLDSTQL